MIFFSYQNLITPVSDLDLAHQGHELGNSLFKPVHYNSVHLHAMSLHSWSERISNYNCESDKVSPLKLSFKVARYSNAY